jgi:hypothetical protein
MTARTELILALPPRQALSIMQYLSAELAERRIDMQAFDAAEQTEVLNAVLQQAGYEAFLPTTVEASEEDAGEAARRFLLLLSEAGDGGLLAELDEWLAEPPVAATAAIPLVVALPIVLTACIIALQMHVTIERSGSGKFSVRIDKPSASDETLVGIATILKGLLGTHQGDAA